MSELKDDIRCPQCMKKCKIHRRRVKEYKNAIVDKFICPRCGYVRYIGTFKKEAPSPKELKEQFMLELMGKIKLPKKETK